MSFLTKLTFIEDVEPVIRNMKKRRMAKFQCECGGTIICEYNNFRNGNTRSCGCLNKEKNIGKKHPFKERVPHTKNRPSGLKYKKRKNED